MSMLRSVLTYMGLGPDEDYDDGYLYEADRRNSSTRPGRLDEPENEVIDLREDDDDDPHAQRNRPDWMEIVDEESIADDDVAPGDELAMTAEPAPGPPAVEEQAVGAPSSPGRHDADRSASEVRPLRAVPTDPDVISPDDGVRVRSVANHGDSQQGSGARARPVRATILAPRSFGDAKILADEFKAAVPVVMNLQEVDRELARRLIDFASGICYAMDGGMEKLAPQVFLLIPDSVEVSDEERRRLEQLGFGS